MANENETRTEVAPSESVVEARRNARHENRPHKITKEDLEFEKLLGYGSYSKVFLAVHKVTGVQYAVKVVSKMQLINEAKHRSAIRERDTLRILNHPNIIKLVSTFQTPDDLHYVLEYAENGELLGHIKKMGRFEYTITKRVTAELVNALEYLRSKKVVHRDIKPENVMLDKDFHVKLVDFGTAIFSDEEPRPLEDLQRLATEDEPETPDAEVSPNHPSRGLASREHSKSFCGTAQYASPELLRHCITTYSSDLWALGCVIYQMVTGQRPFQDPSDYLTFKRIQERDVRYPPDFPPDIRDLCDRLLVLNPCDRLGVGPSGYTQLKAHPFFEGIDFDAILHEAPNFRWKPSAPHWVPDHKVDRCTDCQELFTFFRRKHHCRACGHIFCFLCSHQSIEIPHSDYSQPMRVCRKCYETLKRQNIASAQAELLEKF